MLLLVLLLLLLLYAEHGFCDNSFDIMHESIPFINIEAWTQENSTSSVRLEIAAAVGRACSEIGFFAVKGHSVSQDTIQKLWTMSAEFFELSLEEKLASKSTNISAYPYGYEHTERLQLSMNGKVENDLPDLKETFSLGPSNAESGMPSRRFPNKPFGFQESMEQYYLEMEKLAQTLLSIFASALGLPIDWFSDKMNHHMSALRILNYFPLNASIALPGTLRASPHTDYGVLTILLSGGPGLQVQKSGFESGTWIDVPHIPNVFIINIGDMMQRWTNDRWVSTLHRVVVPKIGNIAMAERRQSIAYFCNVNGDAVVHPIHTCIEPKQEKVKYNSVVAREYLMAKHLASMTADVDSHTMIQSENDEL